ncbi:MAG: hypothetical protein KGL13_02215 [Gammaproteobacteria bacterium]|nr:hypothetical protein [Gammaproteobacteria bacterium]MDE2345261.1 hypothetical protein [Gammaproteobacteria bacterium]
MQAAIDVEGQACNVTVLTWSTESPWNPTCTVNQDQPTHKNFTIDGQQVDLVGDDANGFKVSNQLSLKVPLPATAAPTSKTAVAAAIAKAVNSPNPKPNEVKTPTAAPTPATSATAASAAPGQAFPTQWKLALFPGHRQLVAQNLGYLVKSAGIDINGSACKLQVVFKVRYPPYNLDCVVTTNKRGDLTLLFSPFIVANSAKSATNSILLVSEGESISGIIWDSHGFDSWTPSVPPSWRVKPKSGS